MIPIFTATIANNDFFLIALNKLTLPGLGFSACYGKKTKPNS